MRMRRKKHREERMMACSHLLIEDITKYQDDIKKIFDDDKPLHIEIGCGKGKFITETAQNNPHINYLAVEKISDVIVLALEKANGASLTNVKFLRGDANVFSQFNTASRADRIYINFCDPWRKSGYAKRRLTHENFLNIYKNLLADGGEIHFKTDNKELFEFSLNSFSDFGLKLHNITFDLHNSKFEGNVMTEYETNFSSRGMPIYRCEARFGV